MTDGKWHPGHDERTRDEYGHFKGTMVTFGLWLSCAFLDFDVYGTYAATNVGSVSDMRYRGSLLRQDLFRVSSADANNSGVDDGQKWDE